MPRELNYTVFGLIVRSEIELPELLPNSSDRPPDVTIEWGSVPNSPEQRPGLNIESGGSLLVVPEVGRYWIAEGCRIVVEPTPGVADQNVRLYLLGSALGILLHQRGLVPLHANAVEIAGTAVAFMGKSGAGKSTLAAWFQDQGFPVLADDVCVVEFDNDGLPQVRPGVARLRLWREALVASGRDAADYERSFIGDQAPDKYDVPITEPRIPETRLRLALIYLLDGGDEPRIVPMTGVAALEAAYANTYRGGYVARIGSSHDHWSASLKLVRNSRMFRVERRWGLDCLHDQSALLLEHAVGALRDHQTVSSYP